MDNSCALIGILRKLMIDEDSVARDNSKQSAQMSNLYTEAMRNLAKCKFSSYTNTQIL